MDIWKVWISKDYREYRVRAYRAINHARSLNPPMANFGKLMSEFEDEVALGSVEHFFYEVSKLKEHDLLDQILFSSLFARSVSDWAALLSGFDRDPRSSFSDQELTKAFLALGVKDKELQRFSPNSHPALGKKQP